MKIAVIQPLASDATPTERVNSLSTQISSCAGKQISLFVCPELFTSGYNVGDKLIERAQSPGDAMFGRFAEIAVTNDTAIVFGYPEISSDGTLYNSAACIGPDGSTLANHRKLRLPLGFERDYFRPGSARSYFKLGDLLFALMICYDVEFPENVRQAALAGAHVVIVPTALGRSWPIVANQVIPTRAFENGVYVVYANHAGTEGQTEYLGESCVAGPDGQFVARADSSACILVAEIDSKAIEAARAKIPYLLDSNDLSTF